jgi:transposase-like protein
LEVINMSGKRFDVDVDDLVREYLSGLTVKDLARKHGVNGKTIRRKLPDDVVRSDANRNPVPVVDLAAAVTLFNTGIGVRGVAEQLGCCSPSYLTKLFRDNGIRTRNRSEQQFARMARATQEERHAITEAAHNAVRGVKQPRSLLLNRAKARKRIVSGYELELRDMLTERGIAADPQFPIGTYNCDLAAHPVAVEIFGGRWHWHGKHLASAEKRFRYILNAGWHLLIIAVDAASPLTPSVADYVAAYIEQARCNPSARREYRVIWRAGEDTTAGSLEDDHISIVPPFTNRRDPATGRYERVAR